MSVDFAQTYDDAGMLRRFCEAADEDLALLSLLHDRELTAEVWAELVASEFPDNLGMVLRSERGSQSVAVMREAIRCIGAEFGKDVSDDLAADYASIYLNYSLRISPNESVWTDDENLEKQDAMFQVREWYKGEKLEVTDWRKRSDDHLVIQLSFLRHLLQRGQGDERVLKALAQFMDEHLLRWIDRFGEGVAGRCATPFYAGLAMITASYLDELRDLIAAVVGEPRPSEEEVAGRMKKKVQGDVVPLTFHSSPPANESRRAYG